jgi:hypothetical protein
MEAISYVFWIVIGSVFGNALGYSLYTLLERRADATTKLVVSSAVADYADTLKRLSDECHAYMGCTGPWPWGMSICRRPPNHCGEHSIERDSRDSVPDAVRTPPLGVAELRRHEQATGMAYPTCPSCGYDGWIDRLDAFRKSVKEMK